MPRSKGFFGPSRRRNQPPTGATVPGADRLGHYIYFEHVSTGQKVAFRSFLTNFGESFTCNWNEDHTLYRMDPIPRYQNTRRKLSLGFVVLTESEQEVRGVLNQVQKLQSFLYPEWSKGTNPVKGIGNNIKGAPVIGIRFSNLIARVSHNGEFDYLHGYLSGLSVDFEHDKGFIFDTNTEFSSDVMAPREISINFEFSVLHQDDDREGDTYMGLKVGEGGGLQNQYWPYGVLVPGSRQGATTAEITPGLDPQSAVHSPRGARALNERDTLNENEEPEDNQ